MTRGAVGDKIGIASTIWIAPLVVGVRPVGAVCEHPDWLHCRPIISHRYLEIKSPTLRKDYLLSRDCLFVPLFYLLRNRAGAIASEGHAMPPGPQKSPCLAAAEVLRKFCRKSNGMKHD